MKIHYLTLAMLGAISLSLESCSNDNTLNNNELQENATETEGVYASFTVTAKSVGSFAQSRWVPAQEPAVLKEDEIQDVLVLIYDTSLNDPDLASSTETPKQVEFLTVSNTGNTTDDTHTKIYRTPQFKLSENVTAGDHYVLVIANPDYRPKGAPDYGAGCNADYFKDMTLDAIRKDFYTGGLYRDIKYTGVSGFDRFIMTSDIERKFNLPQSVIDSHGTVDISDDVVDANDGPIVVERLAARIDVSFGPSIVYDDRGNITAHGSKYRNGNSMVTLTNGSPSAAVDSIELPVYDYEAYKLGELLPTYDKFVIGDIDVLNAANNRQLYIQSSNNDDRVRTYFRDENWVRKTGLNADGETYFNGWYASSQVIQADGVTKTDEDHSLGDLIQGKNNLYTDADGVPFYTLGYYRENINCVGTSTLAQAKQGKTAVKITGVYKKASDLQSGYSYHEKELVFTMMHCHLDESTAQKSVPHPRVNGSMSFAIGRNTIYRLRIDKVLCDSEKVYVIWYYDSDNNGKFEEYGTTTPFISTIVDKNTAPND